MRSSFSSGNENYPHLDVFGLPLSGRECVRLCTLVYICELVYGCELCGGTVYVFVVCIGVYCREEKLILPLFF